MMTSVDMAHGAAFARLVFLSIILSCLRRLSEGITNFRVSGLDYSFIRMGIPLLTSKLNYDILRAFFGGKQIEPPSYRKEEVMSQMDSSNKPSAVASLLK